MFLRILHVVSFKEEFLLLDDVDSRQPELSLLLCGSEIGPPAFCFVGWGQGPDTATCVRQSRMTQAIWSNPKNYGRNETTSQCARPPAAHVWLKKSVLSHTHANCCAQVSDRYRRGQERMPECAPHPCSAPTQPGALQCLGRSGIMAGRGDAQKMQHSYCQLSGVCASVINGRLAFCPENCLRSGGTRQSKTTLLMRAGWEFARFSVQNAWRRQWQPTPVPLPGYWKIPWTEEPGRLQSIGSQRVGQNWATSLLFMSHTFFRV